MMKRRLCAAALCLSFMAFCTKVEENPLDSNSTFGLLLSALLLRSTIYVSGGANCTGFTSANGKTWTPMPSGAFSGCSGTGTIYGIAYGGGTFVAVGSLTTPTAGCGIWTSRNGTSWTQQACGGGDATPLRSVAYGNDGLDRFVAGGDNNMVECRFQKSNGNPAVWIKTATTGCAAASQAITGMTFTSTKKFMAHQAGISPYNVFISADGGDTWGAATTPAQTTQKGITPGIGTTLITYGVGGGNGSLSTSTNDGSSWSAMVGHPSITTAFNTAVSGPSAFVAFSTACAMGLSLNNGASWEPVATMGSNCTAININWNTVAYNSEEGLFVAGGNAVSGGAEQFAYTSAPTAGTDTWTIQSLTNSNTINAIAIRP